MKDDSPSREARNLILMRNISVAFLVLILVQFWLGMTVNLEVSLPRNNLPLLSSISLYLETSGFVIAHMILGILLLLLSLLFLTIAYRSCFPALKITGTISFLAVVGAVINGLLFIKSGQFFGWSIGMAMSAVIATISFAIGLYFIGFQSANFSSNPL